MIQTSKLKFIKLIPGNEAEAEKEVNDFMASGVQLMADGIIYTESHVAIMYREAGVMGSAPHTQLNIINNDIQQAQKKASDALVKIAEAEIRIADYEGTDEGKKQLELQKKIHEKDLDFQKKVIVKLKGIYASVQNGTLDTLNL